ncbi:MAG: SDR family NAD(P)-dependent oxidoreductase [Porphyromonadaceae bacterium]|nr:SDR family NAD(P)-dependent oxidoreductase [Porphyromonadaceae bacterium]
MNIENKNIVITGATSGIGLEFLNDFSGIPGTKIVAVGRKVENLPEADNIFPFRADVSKSEAVDELFKFAIEKMGRIDIFFANAGFAYYEKLRNATWQHIDSIFQTNVISPIYSLSKMIELNQSTEFMHIITCSVVGRMPFLGYSLYTGTKYALDGFNSAMQYEMPPNGHLMLVYPVATYTGFFQRASDSAFMPWPRQTTKDVLKAVKKGIAKNRTRVFPYPLIKPILYLMNTFPFVLKIYLSIQKKNQIKAASQ